MVLSYFNDARNVLEASAKGSVGFVDGQAEWGSFGLETFCNERVGKGCSGVVEGNAAEGKVLAFGRCGALRQCGGAEQQEG